MNESRDKLLKETAHLDARGLLRVAVELFGEKLGLASSFGAEDQVLLDMLVKLADKPVVFTLDTGRLPGQTYDLIERTRRRYGIEIEMLFPDYKKVESMVAKHGPNLFYNSLELRKMCCHVRKIEPLERRLAHLEAWICGLRSRQSPTRDKLERVEIDDNFSLLKLSPLADWSDKQLWDYIKANDVPYNALHDQGYPSIGCAPCTRAVAPGQDIRAGRWWWERPEQKECGLHLKS